MSTAFETKIKVIAERELARLAELKPVEFCPLINYFCRTDCVCYAKPRISIVRRKDTDVYSVHPGHCDNSMFLDE